MSSAIKSMQLYPRPERIYGDLKAIGFASGAPVPVDVLNRFDQLHYHGVDALDVAIAAVGITAKDQVLEVGSGWGGCARYIADRTGAEVTAVELQSDYDRVARDLTERSGVAGKVRHVNADFLELAVEPGRYQHAVSWLALFHIPRRADYLAKLHSGLASGGALFAEDLYLIEPPAHDEVDDFNRHLFPNSLVGQGAYLTSLDAAGFDVTTIKDMTQDWTGFTTDRLAAFRDNRDAYVAIHGAEAYDTIEVFYTKMAGYFTRGLVGGLRVAARRRD